MDRNSAPFSATTAALSFPYLKYSLAGEMVVLHSAWVMLAQDSLQFSVFHSLSHPVHGRTALKELVR